MTASKTASRRTSPRKALEVKALKSLRALVLLLNLGAWLSVLAGLFLLWSMLAYGRGAYTLASLILTFATAGVLLWCIRLLETRNELALVVYTWLIAADWVITLLLRVLSSRPLFGFADLLRLVLPTLFILEMYRLRKIGILA